MENRRHYLNSIPTVDVSMYLSEIADRVLLDRPRTLKDQFVRAIERQIDDWLHAHGGPMLMDTSHGHADARIRTAINNENCRDIFELAQRSDRELLNLPNFGRGSLRRLREVTTGKRWKRYP